MCIRDSVLHSTLPSDWASGDGEGLAQEISWWKKAIGSDFYYWLPPPISLARPEEGRADVLSRQWQNEGLPSCNGMWRHPHTGSVTPGWTGKSFVYMCYRTGPTIDPWGTPAATGRTEEFEPSTQILNERPPRYYRIKWKKDVGSGAMASL